MHDNIRSLFHVQSAGFKHPEPSTLQESVEVYAAKTCRDLYLFFGLRAKASVFKAVTRLAIIDCLSDVSDLFDGDKNALRFCIAEAPLKLDTYDFVINRNFILIVPGDRATYWLRGEIEKGVRSIVRCPAKEMHWLAHDMFVELAIANSRCYASILEKAIAKNGIDFIYKKKVEFARKRLGLREFVEADAGYVCFASLLRMGQTITVGTYRATNYLEQLITLWDRFIITMMGDFIPDEKEIVDVLRDWEPFRNQHSPVKLSEKINELDTSEGARAFRLFHLMRNIDSPENRSTYCAVVGKNPKKHDVVIRPITEQNMAAIKKGERIPHLIGPKASSEVSCNGVEDGRFVNIARFIFRKSGSPLEV